MGFLESHYIGLIHLFISSSNIYNTPTIRTILGTKYNAEQRQTMSFLPFGAYSLEWEVTL